MTLAPAASRGPNGIDRFTPAQLLRTARLLAADPGLGNLLDPHARGRQWVELDSTPHLQIWLLSWPAGSGTGWHDHDGSLGVFLTVQGTLREQVWAGGRAHDRTLRSGEGHGFGPRHIHHVSNVGVEAALSLHLYTPRLTSMTRYAASPAGLQATGVERAGTHW